jgi:hypothetical protein
MDEFDRIFEIHSECRVLICTQCQFAVVPSHIAKHLKAHHKRLPQHERRNIIARVQSRTDLAQLEREVVYPRVGDPPIANLPVFFDGLSCTGKNATGEPCVYVCRTLQGIQEHCKVEHGWINQQKRGGDARTKRVHTSNKLWECHRTCQRLFLAGSWKRYFEVNGSSPEASTEQRTGRRQDFFRLQAEDVRQLEQDAAEDAN